MIHVNRPASFGTVNIRHSRTRWVIGVSYLFYGDGTPSIGNVQLASSYSAVHTLGTPEKCLHDKLQKPFREMLPAEGRAVV